MRKFLALSASIVAAAALNVGCSASASVHKADNAKLNTATRVAYVSAPARQ